MCLIYLLCFPSKMTRHLVRKLSLFHSIFFCVCCLFALFFSHSIAFSIYVYLFLSFIRWNLKDELFEYHIVARDSYAYQCFKYPAQILKDMHNFERLRMWWCVYMSRSQRACAIEVVYLCLRYDIFHGLVHHYQDRSVDTRFSLISTQ